jgi:hypothetical protein
MVDRKRLHPALIVLSLAFLIALMLLSLAFGAPTLPLRPTDQQQPPAAFARMPWATTADLESAAISSVGMLPCRHGPAMRIDVSLDGKSYQYYQTGEDFLLVEMRDPGAPRYAWVGHEASDKTLVVERAFEYDLERDGRSPCPFLRGKEKS